MRNHLLVLIGTALFVLAPDQPLAAAAGEGIVLSLPRDFKEGYAAEDALMRMIEFVPNNEAVENWSQLVTVQLFHSLKVDPDVLPLQMSTSFSNACPAGQALPVGRMVENGYPASVWSFN